MAESKETAPVVPENMRANTGGETPVTSEELSIEQEREALKKARDADSPDINGGDGEASHGNLHFGEQEEGEYLKTDAAQDGDSADFGVVEDGIDDTRAAGEHAGEDGEEAPVKVSVTDDAGEGDAAAAGQSVEGPETGDPTGDAEHQAPTDDSASKSADGASPAKPESEANADDGSTAERTPVNEAPTDIELSNNAVAENDSGALVATLTATDPDANDTATFTIVDDSSGLFEIVGNELRLRDGVSVDYEAQDAYEIVIEVEDSAGNTYVQSVTINVEDINEGPADVSLSNTTINENAEGVVVGTLSAVDPDAGDTLTYTVSDDRFEVVGNELRVRDGVSFDHETIGSIDVTVTATDSGGLESSESFTINIADVNEAPTDVSLSNATINENDAGAVVGTLSAVDPDAGDTLTYTVSDDRFEVVGNELRVREGVSFDHETIDSIDVTVTATDSGGLESSESFTINVADVNEGPADVSLSNDTINENDAGAVVGTLSAVDPDAGDTVTFTVSDDRFEVVGNELRVRDGVSFDHETIDSIDVTVTATDSGSLESSESFTINIADVNESPTDVSLSNATINENDAGAVVGTLSAVDPDAGDTLTYTVSDDRFEVVGNELRVRDGVSFDHETIDAIDVTVTATDSGGLESSESFTINIADVNEAPTDVSLSNATINENDAGAVVATLSAVDPDAGDTLTYTVSDDRFEVVGNELRVRDGVSFDHETIDSIDVTVTATDSGGLESSESFTINIADVNEGPTDISLSNASVGENAPGAVVGTLSAVDPDAGDSLTYTVSDDRFEVVGNELRVREGVLIDHETVDAIDVIVTASDSEGLESTQNFTINITDGNEGPSLGLATGSGLQVSFFNIGHSLSNLDQIDFDATPDAEAIVDSLDHMQGGVPFWEGGPNDYFAARYEGQIIVENGGTYTFNMASDDGSMLFIDGEPVLDNDGLHGTRTRTVTIDLDEGAHDIEVRYFENGGAQTLQLSWSGPDTSGAREVIGGDTYQHGYNADNLSVGDDEAGAIVAELTVSDPDAGDSHTFAVSDDRFEVVEEDGAYILKLKDGESLDFETESSVDISVTVTDSSGASDTAVYSVAVDNVNAAPDISLNGGEGLQASYYNIGHSLSNLDQIDFDAAPDAQAVVDSIDHMQGGEPFWEGGPDNYFAARYEGQIVVETGGTYTFSMASDDGSMLFIDGEPVLDNDGLHGTRTRTVTIDLDEGAHDIEVRYFENGGAQTLQLSWSGPDTGGAQEVIGGDSYRLPGFDEADILSVDENVAGDVAALLSITDPDGDAVTYAVSDDRFELVETENGVALKLKDDVSLDHETTSEVTVTVTATDEHGESSSEDFTIPVADINEAPTDIFMSGGTVNENEAGALVGTLSSADPDIGDTATFTIVDDPSGMFEIVGNELRLKDGVSLDYETQDSHELTVQVTDSGGESHWETMTVNVADIAEANVIEGTNRADRLNGTNAADEISGYSGNDRIYGRGGDDVIDGGDGRDTIRGGAGDDIIDGGSGNDKIRGDAGADELYGGDGNDRIYADSDDTVIDGGAGTDRVTVQGNDDFTLDMTAASVERVDGGGGNDTLDATGSTARVTQRGNGGDDTLIGGENRDNQQGGAGNDTIFGNGGNDSIRGNAGDDVIDGGDGNDTIRGDAGADVLRGGAGNDRIYADSDDTVIDGGAGTDRVTVQGNDDFTLDMTAASVERVDGGGGNDRLDATGSTARVTQLGNGGDDTLIGGENRDNQQGGAGNDSIFGNGGNDSIRGNAGDDVIDGGDGNDTIRGDAGADVLRGGAGNDRIYADSDDTVIDGGAGTDRVIVQGNDDFALDMTASSVERVDGGGGNDTLDASGSTARVTQLGNGGDDTLIGGDNRDNQQGGAGNDTIFGNGGRDTIRGGAGDDIIIGGDDRDTLYGDDGSDVFVYEMGDGSDRIFGGAGGGWTDTILLSDGDSPLGEYGVDWTIEVTDGSIISVDENGITLSEDADGIITLSDGATIQFTDIEEIII